MADVAAHLGIKSSTVTAYLARGQMPAADGYVGRSPWWWSTTIKAWRTVYPAPAACRVCGSTAQANAAGAVRRLDASGRELALCRAHAAVCERHLLDPCAECDT